MEEVLANPPLPERSESDEGPDFNPVKNSQLRRLGHKKKTKRMEAAAQISATLIDRERRTLRTILHWILQTLLHSRLECYRAVKSLEYIHPPFDAQDVLRVLSSMAARQDEQGFVALFVLNKVLKGQYAPLLLLKPPRLIALADSIEAVFTQRQLSPKVVLSLFHMLRTINGDSLDGLLEVLLKSTHNVEFRKQHFMDLFRNLLLTFKGRDLLMDLAAKLVESLGDFPGLIADVIKLLNVSLVSSPGLLEVREELRKKMHGDLFSRMFPVWSHSVAAAVTICLLSQNYELLGGIISEGATELVQEIEEVQQIVEALETEAFVHLRLQLVNANSDKFPSLTRVLYSLLMVVPENTEAFRMLNSRLGVMEKVKADVIMGMEAKTMEGWERSWLDTFISNIQKVRKVPA